MRYLLLFVFHISIWYMVYGIFTPKPPLDAATHIKFDFLMRSAALFTSLQLLDYLLEWILNSKFLHVIQLLLFQTYDESFFRKKMSQNEIR